MHPVVHLAVGYLAYAGYSRWQQGEPPATGPAVVAIFGAALPDLIDKPLDTLGVVAVGRTIGHSLLFAIPLVVLVYVLFRRRDQVVLGVAFAIGYLSHIAADVPWHLFWGDFHELGFLLWPLTPMPEYAAVKPLGTIAGTTVTTMWLEAVILVIGVAIWIRDGAPGVGWIIRRVVDR